MSVVQAIVLGILQGFAEFLPISSSAHLALAPWVLGWPQPGLAFDASLHIGTLAAVLVYFRRQWLALLAAAWRIVTRMRRGGPEERQVVYLVIATIPGGIAGLLLDDYAETIFRGPALIAAMLILMGIVLWAVDRSAKATKTLDEVRWTDALLLGLAQVLALVPGVSRSGSTMTAGRALGLSRESAATFSFLMSMPITAAAAAFKLPDALSTTGVAVPLIAGVVAAALSAWVAIAVLLRYLARHSFGVFALYRLLLGAAVLALVATRG